MANLARRALPPEHRRDDVIDQAAAAMREEYSRRWQRQTRPYPGIPELLRTLSLREIKLGVLTNKPDNLAKSIVAAYFPDIIFTAVAGANPSLPLKPDPTGALSLAQQFALPPATIIFVGDSGTDMETASAAGMYAAGALWGFRTAEELARGWSPNPAADTSRPPDAVHMMLGAPSNGQFCHDSSQEL